jgi:CHAT domain-containing protein
MVNGKAVTGNRVYAKDFKSDASRYDILHLSMHTAINDNLPMYSKLIFNTNSDSTASGWINTYEIYNMKFNARMAVLSACNSGSGYIYKSEGAMSLARAFMYSGCQSVVMTLWGIADISAAAIMINFYHNLKKGKTKDVALREAKLNYIHSLKRPINAHPAYWQAFVTIGNQSALFYDFTSYITIALLTIVGIALLLAFRFKRQ